MTAPLLAIEGLRVRFPGDPLRGTADHIAVDRVDLTLKPGRILCVVGESGAGKSTIAAAVLGLIDPPGRIEAGRIELEGRDLATMDERAMRAVRGRRIGAIFQDPLSALNPVLTIGAQMVPAIRHATGLGPSAARDRAVELLAQVAIPEPATRLRQYPHQLSGGMRQRVVIAIAIAGSPALLVADEPTTALDVSIQAEVLDVIRDLARGRGIGVLLITHDMAVVAGIADDVAVMRHGRLVEAGPATQVLFAPREAYTRALIEAVPRPDAAPPPALESTDPILALEGVSVTFAGPRTLRAADRRKVQALDAVSLRLGRGESLGLVGESGSGKSTLARVACGLQAPDAGTVTYEGHDITALARDPRLRHHALSMQMVFQDPYASLDPRQTVLSALTEPLVLRGLARADRRARAVAALEAVGMTEADGAKIPHAFSGGQRQRVSIARALVMEPSLLICDEPTSALDVSVQAQVLALLADLRARLGLSLLFVSHDLAVVRQVCDRVAVMRAGRIVETGTVADIFERPSHAYTCHLIETSPRFEPRREAQPA